MSGAEIILWLALVVLVGSSLYIKHRQRVRSQPERYDPAKWTGKAIDVTQLKPKVENVRRNYLAARQPPKDLCFRRALIEMARRAVAQLAYFHDRAPEHQAQAHGP